MNVKDNEVQAYKAAWNELDKYMQA